MPSVTMIPATINRRTQAPISENRKRKVAAYARVSTDEEEQLTSYEAQCDYYTNYIKSRDDWEFAGLYADEGISGTNTKYREGFNKMIDDALAGKIQLIITKSVSRFARNTVDSLSTIRKLKDSNVECYFEKEGLWTFDSKSEVILSIMSSLAQEESRSISENVKWGIRKKYEDGRFSMPYSSFLGYDRGEDGMMVINEEQAKIVRRIFGLYLSGRSPYRITKILMAEGIPTVTGKKTWHAETIRSILSNEKYSGSARLQKKYTVSYLTKEMRENHGEVPQYLVQDSHPAIIDPETFEEVQRMMERKKGKGHTSSVTAFSSKIRCGDCGSWYGSKVWHSTDKYRKIIYQCNHKFANKEKKCETPHFTDQEIKELFIKALNIYCEEKDEIIRALTKIGDSVFDTSEFEKEQAEMSTEMNVVAGLIEELIAENASKLQDQTEYNRKYDALADRFENAKKRHDEAAAETNRLLFERDKTERFLKELKKLPETVTEFDEDAWYALVDYLTAYRDGSVVFRFKDGKEVTVKK